MYNTCPNCGLALDPGEECEDCKEKEERIKQLSEKISPDNDGQYQLKFENEEKERYMKKIVVKKAHMENFKRFSSQTIDFGEKVTSIYAQNYKGKSSIADAFCWVMFNKSSTGNTEGSQFRPRRYDSDGKNVDRVDVVVELELLIDGEPLKIKKIQRQKWVRHHGDDFDSYMGDETLYEWNDVPVTPTLHKAKVEEIISEDVFRMISNPVAFPSLPAKKQREFLLNNVANITDDDVFAIKPEFAPIKEAMGKNSLEELLARTKKEISGYMKKQEEIPVRIDQESKRIEDIDFSAKEAELAKLQEELANVESQLLSTSKAYEQLNELRVQKAAIEGIILACKSKADRDYEAEKRNIQSQIDAANQEFSNAQSKHSSLESALTIHKARIESCNEKLAVLREKYTLEMAKEMPADSYNCPTCGQYMPDDQRETIKAEFESNKRDAINSINKEGQETSAEINRLKKEIYEYEVQIESLKQTKIDSMDKYKIASEKLAKFSANPVDYESNPEYVDMVSKLEAVEKEIAGIDVSDADALKEKLQSERAAIQKSIDEVKESLALKKVIEQSKATIKELEAEMVTVTQELANREKLESTIEKFNKEKMDMLSERINDKFKIVKWKLFEKQKNQKYAEVCVCMVNGSCYGENTTSATESMMAGMDIISTLQSIYEVEAPIFLDDADLYNEWNIPAMDSQLIKLCVSDDADLRVEGE